MSIKKIFSPAASIISLFIFIFYFAINSNAEDNNSKYYSKDEGVVSIMYHRFNENKYPSTNIKIDIFKEHLQIIKDSSYNFLNPEDLEGLTEYEIQLEREFAETFAKSPEYWFTVDKVQQGGYSKIVNPNTGRKVSIYGKIGRQVIQTYINQNYINPSYKFKKIDF